MFYVTDETSGLEMGPVDIHTARVIAKNSKAKNYSYYDSDLQMHATPVFSELGVVTHFEPIEVYCDVCGHNYPIDEPCAYH